MKKKWSSVLCVVFLVVIVFQPPIQPSSGIVSFPHYFIAIHNEPAHIGLEQNANGEDFRKQSLQALVEMVTYAQEKGIHLTLMFTPQWASLLTKEENKHYLDEWKQQGHEISAHHHGIRHSNWDGYTNYSPEVAEKQRLQELHSPRTPNNKPEPYLGTLADAMKEWEKLNPTMHTGCMNAEFDKNEIPQGITIDTSSGYMNTGLVGVRKMNDGTSPTIGVNEYILQGTVNNQPVHWLSHYLLGQREGLLPAVFETIENCSSNSVYGFVFHSSYREMDTFKQCMDYLHKNDSESNRSVTLDEVVQKNLLPIKTLPEEFLGINNRSYETPPVGFHPASIKKLHYNENGFTHAYNLGVNTTREGVYAFWNIVQPTLSSPFYNFQLYDHQWFSVPANIRILGNIAAQTPDETSRLLLGSWVPVDIPAYQEFVKAIVERYDGDGIEDMPGLTNPILYWQVGNEPNAVMPRRSDYATYQKITYEAIKEACPTAQVLVAGAAGGPDNYLRNFNEFYQPVLQELNGQYIDIFDFHWYGNALGDYQFVDPIQQKNVLHEIRTTLTNCGFSKLLPIWITEMGTYSGVLENPPNWNSYQTEEEQAADFIKRCFYSWANGVDTVLMAFGLIEGFKQDAGYFDHTGFIYDGEGIFDYGLGVKKLSYFSTKFITQHFHNLQPKQLTLLSEKGKSTILKWEAPTGECTYILWRNEPSSWFDPSLEVTLKLPEFNSEAVTATEMIPHAFTGKDLENQEFYSLFRTTQLQPDTEGTYTVKLGTTPICLRKLP